MKIPQEPPNGKLPMADFTAMMALSAKHSDAGVRKPGRGLGQKTLAIINAASAWLSEAQPASGRAAGYQLFSAKISPSMSTRDMQRVYHALGQARERGLIPWEWIVDEVRDLEQLPSWDDPKQYIETVRQSFRRNFWAQQPCRVEVWSEKGTVRGVLQPTLDEYGVGFRRVGGWNSKTVMHEVATSDDSQPLHVLYVGDWDPSGMAMSERDDRLERYGGHHVKFRRIALLESDTERIGRALAFPASDKRKDPNYRWFVAKYGDWCWELDAMDPRDLRERAQQEIKRHIEPEAWSRCVRAQVAEERSLKRFLDSWTPPRPRRGKQRAA